MENSNDGRIYEKRGNLLCLVKTFELYMNRIDPDYPYLWQQAKSSVSWEDAYWYNGTPVSKNKIGNLMTFLTKEAKLSQSYTNHCIRNTCITVLDQSGHEARHIMTVSGHKKIESIQNYAHRTSATNKREMSESLASALVQLQVKKAKNEVQAPCATVSKPPPEIPKMEFSTVDQAQIRDLLEITPDEEHDLLKELFNTPFEAPTLVNNVVKTVSNVSENNPKIASVAPKMIFQNSNVTINFNITRTNN